MESSLVWLSLQFEADLPTPPERAEGCVGHQLCGVPSLCLAEHWARARGALQGQWLCPCDLLAALGCPGAVPGAVPWQGGAGRPCGGGAQSSGVMPFWHHEKQERAEVTRSKKMQGLGLGGGQPPAGESCESPLPRTTVLCCMWDPLPVQGASGPHPHPTVLWADPALFASRT